MIERQELREWQERQTREARKWQIVQAVVVAIVGGLFALIGAYIQWTATHGP